MEEWVFGTTRGDLKEPSTRELRNLPSNKILKPHNLRYGLPIVSIVIPLGGGYLLGSLI